MIKAKEFWKQVYLLIVRGLFFFSSIGHAEEREDHEYYNEIPGKQPPAGGVSDVRIKVQATDQMAYCPIRCEKLCYLVSNSLLLL